jgi:hypothetical protein
MLFVLSLSLSVNPAAVTSRRRARSSQRRDSALLPLSAGNYTAITRDANRTTGITVAESYKLDN